MALKRTLIRREAEISRRLHTQGINYRDHYLCHFLMPELLEQPSASAQNLHSYLIVLHWVQLRSRTPLRWIIKDIGALYFSAMRIGLTRRDIYRFMQVYLNSSIRDALQQLTSLFLRHATLTGVSDLLWIGWLSSSE